MTGDADIPEETPPVPPAGCPIADVLAVVARLLTDRGHRLDRDEIDMTRPMAEQGAVLLLTAFGVPAIPPGRPERVRAVPAPADSRRPACFPHIG